MIADSVPLTVILQTLIDRLSRASSAQTALLLKTERALAARRREIEQSCAATVLAPRPLVGETHPRDPPLIQWGDDLSIALFARAPYSSHDAIRVLCRKYNGLLRSDAFRQERIKSKCAENGAAIV